MANRRFGNAFFPIELHCWGGLGSQLFALVAASRIKVLFPRRRVKLVFHSSGVSRRTLELPVESLSDFEVQIIDDFLIRTESKTEMVAKRIRSSIRLTLRRIFNWTGILSTLNCEADFSSIRKWVLQIRGHYTRLNLTNTEVFMVNQLLNSPSILGDQVISELAIHFRLGDLRQLSIKSFVSEGSIQSIMTKFRCNSLIRVFSESTEIEVLEAWPHLKNYTDIQIHQLNPYETATHCINSINFIGTSAKLSIWIAVIRIALGKEEKTALPITLGPTVRDLLLNFPHQEKLILY